MREGLTDRMKEKKRKRRDWKKERRENVYI